MIPMRARLVLTAASFLVLFPQDLHADFFKLDSNTNNTRGFFSFLFGRPRTCNCLCGRPNRVTGRIQSGEFTQTHEFPWLTAIIINGTRVASGSLINDRYIITANSPLVGLTPYDVKVTLGAFDRCASDLSSVNDSITSIIPLPNFDSRTGNHDIALLKLTNPVTFSRNINPICLPDAGARYLGQVVTVASWGNQNITNANIQPGIPTSSTTTTTTTTTTAAPAGRRRRETGLGLLSDIGPYNEYDRADVEDMLLKEAEQFYRSWFEPNSRSERQISPTLATLATNEACLPKKLGLPVLGEGRCPDASINTLQITQDTGCAGISGAPNQVCRNDTGAPVQFRDHRGIYQLAGVISVNNQCNNTLPTLYTRVNGYVNWIYSNTQDACYCSQSVKFGF